MLIASCDAFKPSLTEQSFESWQFDGVISTVKFADDGRFVAALLGKLQRQVVLISVPAPGLFGEVAAIAFGAATVGVDIGCAALDCGIVANGEKQCTARFEDAAPVRSRENTSIRTFLPLPSFFLL